VYIRRCWVINNQIASGILLYIVHMLFALINVVRCCKTERYLHIILYADDILFWHHQSLSLKGCWGNVKNSVTLIWLLTSRLKKSACLRVGPRCEEITTYTGNSISWVNQMRYLGVFFVKSRVFKCNLDHVNVAFVERLMQYLAG